MSVTAVAATASVGAGASSSIACSSRSHCHWQHPGLKGSVSATLGSTRGRWSLCLFLPPPHPCCPAAQQLAAAAAAAARPYFPAQHQTLMVKLFNK